MTSIAGISISQAPSAMPSDGGSDLVLTGANFGPLSLFSIDVSQAVVFSYGYSLSDATSLVYTAANCYKSVAHTEISCKSVAGVGSRLVASIAVSGVVGTVAVSNLTSLAYAPPVVTRVSGAGATNANTAGGGLITVEGSGFGPASLNGAATLAPTSPGWQRGVGGLFYGRYAASGCAVLSSSLLTCSSVQGTGAGYSWTLAIAGQNVSVTLGACSLTYYTKCVYFNISYVALPS